MLDQLLQKLGITDYDKLTGEERKTYQAWAKVLTTKDATIEDVRKFVAAEKARAFDELLKLDTSKEHQLFFKVLLRMTDALNAMLTIPAAQRDQLKAHLKQTFDIEI